MPMVPRHHKVTHHHSRTMALLLHNKAMEAMDSRHHHLSSMGTTRAPLHNNTATMARRRHKVKYRRHSSHLVLA